MSVIKLKPNLCTTYIELCKILEGEIERLMKMAAAITTILKFKLLC